MSNIPQEFSSCSKYQVVSETVYPYNRIVSLVFSHIFLDSCVNILSTTRSPEAFQFVDEYQKGLPPFPVDGPSETMCFADDLFESLMNKMRAGKITTKMPNQLWLCSTLYSVLEGEEAEKKEVICKVAAAKMRRMLNEGSVKTLNKLKNGLRLKLKVGTNNQASSTVDEHAKGKPDLNNILMNYNENDVMEYLLYLGVSIPNTSPQLKQICKPGVQMNLDLCMSFLGRGDKKGALTYLQAAQRIWKTGKPE